MRRKIRRKVAEYFRIKISATNTYFSILEDFSSIELSKRYLRKEKAIEELRELRRRTYEKVVLVRVHVYDYRE